jgi:Tfp pilus assembly protein PilO
MSNAEAVTTVTAHPGTEAKPSPAPHRSAATFFAHAWQIDAAGVALCALLTAGAYFAAWQPLQNGRAAGEAREAALSLARAQASALSANSRAVRTQLTNAQAAVARFEIPLQPASMVNQRMAELTSLANECGLDVQYAQTGAVTSNPRYAQLPIQLSGAGTYRTCAQFLHRLRERFPDTGIKCLDVAATPSESSTVTSFDFQLVWYVQPTTATR